jgi:hypothetical protein
MAPFSQTGFVQVEQKDCHVSRIPGIHEVEDPSRILDGAGVCVEGVKPQIPMINDSILISQATS